MEVSKVQRKVKRKQAQYLKQEPDTDLRFQEDPSVHMFIGNGGLKNGVPREVLEYILNPCPSKTYLEQLYLPPGKDFAFATFTSILNASECLAFLNGVCIQEVCNSLKPLPSVLSNGPPVHLFMSYVNKIPTDVSTGVVVEDCKQLPPGLLLVEDFVSIQEEEQLLTFFSFASEDKRQPIPAGVTSLETTDECSPRATTLKHRQVMHFGYEFLYGSNLVDPNCPLPGGLPAITQPLLDRMAERGLIAEHPDQLTLNKYSPGSGISSHVDTHSVFQGPIISLSLRSQVVMEFKHPVNGVKIPVLLSPRSLLVMTGEVRHLWSHGIPARMWDEIATGLLRHPLAPPPHERNLIPRGTRISLTFRKIRPQPSVCSCDYPLQCDSQKPSSTQ